MTNKELKELLHDCKASVIFEMEQAQYMGEGRRAIELCQLVDEVDIAIGKADAKLFELTLPKKDVYDINALEYLHSKLKL